MLDIKKRFVSLALAGSLLGVSAVGAAAAPPTQQGGAAGLVAAVVQAIDTVDVNNNQIDVAVVELNNSLNNLTALNNVLNNSPILSNNDVIDNITIGDISVLDQAQIDVLSGININVEDIVAVVELLSGDFIVVTR